MDTRKAIFPHLYTFEKLFPIPSSPKDFKLLSEFKSLSDQLLEIFQVAPHKLSWPACLRCCCCKTKKRTSCGCFYSVLFGRTKQLGYILQKEYNAEHYWIKTKDGCKLDGMLFRQSSEVIKRS